MPPTACQIVLAGMASVWNAEETGVMPGFFKIRHKM